MKLERPEDRIIVALDASDPGNILELAKTLSPHVGFIKIGFEAVFSMLRSIVNASSETEAMKFVQSIRELFRIDLGIFIDGKLNDIPNTVGKASLAISGTQGVGMLNLHASAGLKAIRQAVENKGDCEVFGVTVLTSLGEAECHSIFGETPNVKVVQFAGMLETEGADGVICAPKEAQLLKEKGCRLKLACPGIRPLWSLTDDQDPKRVMTPEKAIQAGVDRIIMGRPITRPPEGYGPSTEAAQRVAQEIGKALSLPRGGE
tara:strand:+ start:136 stop:918 length:783 start_codon:yes stop_codon:yes gene_type:complete